MPPAIAVLSGPRLYSSAMPSYSFLTSTPDVQPIYGLEVGILGMRDVLWAQPVIDRYIRSKYGDVIACSRLALNGDTYCVVFKMWSQTSCFVNDTFTAFDSGYGVSHSISQTRPALLYVFNNDGLPPSTRASEPSNVLLRQLQAQVDMLQHKADTGAHAFQTLVHQQDKLTYELCDNAQRTAACLTNFSTVFSTTARLQAANAHLENLQSDTRTYHLLLTFTPPDRQAIIMSHLHENESQISRQHADIIQAQESLNAAERMAPTISYGSALPLPAPSSRVPSTSNHRPCPLDDGSPGSPDHNRCLCARLILNQVRSVMTHLLLLIR